MKKPGEKREDLCVVTGCKNRRDVEGDNWRCEKHSVMYYGSVVGVGRNESIKDPDVFHD
jgi:hypothetical protein